MLSKYVFSNKRNLFVTSIVDGIGKILFFWIKKGRVIKDVNRILIIRVDHIGDVITTIPSLRVLRKSFPNAKISVLVRSLTKDLLMNCPYIDELIVYNPPWYRGKKDLNLLRSLRLFRNLRKRKFDLAIDFRGDLRNIFLAFLCGSKFRLAYDVKGGDFLLTHIAHYKEGSFHAIDRNLGVLEKLKIKCNDRKLELWIPKEVQKKIKLPYKKFVVIHPGSGGHLKLWTAEGFAKVADHIIKNHKSEVVITGSPSDVKLAEMIEDKMEYQALNIVGRTDLLELAEIIRRAKMLISPDSGPMHMAVALGTPTVSLFGTSLSEVWGYRSERNIIIEKKGNLKNINPENVIRAVDKLWRIK